MRRLAADIAARKVSLAATTRHVRSQLAIALSSPQGLGEHLIGDPVQGVVEVLVTTAADELW